VPSINIQVYQIPRLVYICTRFEAPVIGTLRVTKWRVQSRWNAMIHCPRKWRTVLHPSHILFSLSEWPFPCTYSSIPFNIDMLVVANVPGSKEHRTYNVGNAGTLNPSIRHVITLLILQNETAGANYWTLHNN